MTYCRVMVPIPYRLIWPSIIREHLDAIDAKYHRLIIAEAEKQLAHEPNVETKNRKPLKRPADIGATWELRLGPTNRFRVFYDVAEFGHTVDVVSVGEKIRERLYIAGKVIGK